MVLKTELEMCSQVRISEEIRLDREARYRRVRGRVVSYCFCSGRIVGLSGGLSRQLFEYLRAATPRGALVPGAGRAAEPSCRLEAGHWAGESSSKLIAQVDSAFESNSYRCRRVSPRGTGS